MKNRKFPKIENSNIETIKTNKIFNSQLFNFAIGKAADRGGKEGPVAGGEAEERRVLEAGHCCGGRKCFCRRACPLSRPRGLSTKRHLLPRRLGAGRCFFPLSRNSEVRHSLRKKRAFGRAGSRTENTNANILA